MSEKSKSCNCSNREECSNCNSTKLSTSCPKCFLPYFNDGSSSSTETCKCIQHSYPVPPVTGWICGKCGSSNSPLTATCPNCAPPMRVTCNV